MLENHELKLLLEHEKWNNIPVCVKEMFEKIVDYVVDGDVGRWERKIVNNDRFFKLQHLSISLN